MKNSNSNRKIFLVKISLLLIFIALILTLNKKNYISCQEFSIPLKNILENEEKLKNSSTSKIFLIETHMEKERSLNDFGQACSVESAALMNSDAEVYFIFASNADGINLKFNDLIYQLKFYSNLNLAYLNPIEISKGTVAESFFRDGKMKDSSFPLEHMADALRMLLLHIYGGQYLDLDVFSLAPISEIKRKNFACVETKDYICNGIMNLDTDENGGKAISKKYLELLNSNYFPSRWNSIGPLLVTQVIKELCPNTTLDVNNATTCGNFTSLPTTKCYPILFSEWMKIFEAQHKNYVLEKIEESQSYFFHMWSAMKRHSRFHSKGIEPDSAYMHLAKKHCPRVYEIMMKNTS